MKKVNKELVIKKAIEYATSFIWCFSKESTHSYMNRFANDRFTNMVDEDIQIEKVMEDDNAENYRNLFAKTFEDEVKELLPKKAQLEPTYGTSDIDMNESAEEGDNE